MDNPAANSIASPTNANRSLPSGLAPSEAQAQPFNARCLREKLTDALLETALQLRQGTLLAGRYEVRELIGRGGMGLVYAAYDAERQEVIALKVLAPNLLGQPDARVQFRQEAKLTSDLNHPNIVNVYDLGSDHGRDFLTMEKLQGRTLREEIQLRKKEERQFQFSEAMQIVTGVCSALEYAHHFTIHHDIKPENIWICSDGTVKVMDFGLAKLLHRHERTERDCPPTGLSMGTPYYVAPEVLQGAGSGDVRADQYSAAVVFYELLSGQVPAGMAKPLHQLCPHLKKPVSDVIARALSPNADARYPNIAAFHQALREASGKVVWQPKSNLALACSAFGLAAAAALLVFSGLGMIRHWKNVKINDAHQHERAVDFRDRLTAALEQTALRLAQIQQALADRSPQAGRSFEPVTVERIQSMIRQADDAIAQSNPSDSLRALVLAEAELQHLNKRIEQATAANSAAESAQSFMAAIPESERDPEQIAALNLWTNAMAHLQQGSFEDAKTLFESFSATQKKLHSESMAPLLKDLQEAQNRWESHFPPGFVPRLDHLDGPYPPMEQGQQLLESGDLTGARRELERAASIFWQWHREVRELEERTDRHLAQLNVTNVITNALGMRFISVGDFRISAWEIRVMDFAVYELVARKRNLTIHSLWKELGLAQTPTSPVVGISFPEASGFCNGLTQLIWDELKINTGHDMYRLLRRPEMDHLQERLGAGRLALGFYAFANLWPPPYQKGHHLSDPFLDPHRYLRPVASGPPNPLGIFDFEGNAWEWTMIRQEGPPHWVDGDRYQQLLCGGGFFGAVTHGGNRMLPSGFFDVGHARAIGLRVVLKDNDKAN